MSAKHKPGIDFFPTDVTFLSDTKIRRIIKQEGGIVVSIWFKLISLVYTEQGYYIPYDDNLIFSIAEALYLEEEKVDEVIRGLVKAGLLNADKLEKYGILTSKAIQDNYLFITKRRKERILNNDYLIDPPTHNEAHDNDQVLSCKQDVYNMQENVCNGQQRKEKERKEKESEGEGEKKRASTRDVLPSPPPPSGGNYFRMNSPDVDIGRYF